MPEYRRITLDEAKKSLTSETADRSAGEYAAYVEALAPGQAGLLEVAPDEMVGVVRSRLSAAARSVGKHIIIRRVGQQIIFWLSDANPPQLHRAPKGP